MHLSKSHTSSPIIIKAILIYFKGRKPALLYLLSAECFNCDTVSVCELYAYKTLKENCLFVLTLSLEHTLRNY